MSGWKRLGVVISVLWLIGSPIYFQVAEARRAEREYKACTSINPAEDVLARSFQLALCNPRRQSLTIADAWELMTLRPSPEVLKANDPAVGRSVGAFLAGFLWLMWLGPIALLWIVGGLVIGTTRWVMRGFTRRSDTASLQPYQKNLNFRQS
jgi:hypothetical protein